MPPDSQVSNSGCNKRSYPMELPQCSQCCDSVSRRVIVFHANFPTTSLNSSRFSLVIPLLIAVALAPGQCMSIGGCSRCESPARLRGQLDNGRGLQANSLQRLRRENAVKHVEHGSCPSLPPVTSRTFLNSPTYTGLCCCHCTLKVPISCSGGVT